MDLNFNNLFYDFKSDTPIAILNDNLGKSFYFKISPNIANQIINFLENDRKITNNMYNIFIDVLNNSSCNINKLTIEKFENGNYTGYFQVKIEDKVFYYYLSSDDIILLSVLFDRFVEIDPFVFYDFLEPQNDVLYSEKLYEPMIEN
ncbi:MAG: hypothetical protein A2086_01790 [Spirochaetes bacterium GWD1_27_9]|nr:MAG: hypothetical protein A2Z98_09800 [Spirochaetes bacterium GWB1_27_13]OHD25669.1 MAG: hypothetical protein A2Y34_02255 [Spirochaetes bacterium GWC1_27_15]OHD41596.1 MAG: hypothetical protein A2086_01790 [Spirochaetes bacterium GWD1_27_9]